MGHYEKLWLNNYTGPKVLYYRRYVDDIICCFRNSGPTTLRDLIRSNHWATGDYGEQGFFCRSRLEPHHMATQPSNDWHT